MPVFKREVGVQKRQHPEPLCRSAQKAEEERAADRISVLTQRRKSKAAALGTEPALNSADSVQIRVRLPDGRNFQRCFLATEPLQVQKLLLWKQTLSVLLLGQCACTSKCFLAPLVGLQGK